MPVVRLYHSELSFYGSARRGGPLVVIEEWSFDAPAIGEWAEEGRMKVARWWAREVFLRCPPLSRLVPYDYAAKVSPRPWTGPAATRALSLPQKLACGGSFDLIAELAVHAARTGRPGLSFISKEEALRMQPSLFADLADLDDDRPAARPMAATEAAAAAAAVPAAIVGSVPSITPENLSSVLTALADDPIAVANPKIKLMLLGIACAIARCRSSGEGNVVLVAAGLEVVLEDVLERRVGAPPIKKRRCT